MQTNTKRLSYNMFVGIIFSFLLTCYSIVNDLDSDVKSKYLVTIVATGNSSDYSKGKEIWLYKIEGKNWRIKSHDDGWENRNGVWVSYNQQPAKLTFSSESLPSLTFATHPYSGLVTIISNGNEYSYNLYSKYQKIIEITPFNIWGKLDIFLFIFLCIIFSIFSYILSLLMKEKTYSIFLVSVISFIVASIVLYTFYPGTYTNDSADQLHQAITSNYSDWHPPLMSFFWSILLSYTPSYPILFSIIVVLFVLGMLGVSVFLIIEHRYIAALFTPLLTFTPYIVNFIGVVWKDVFLAASLLVSVSILLFANYSKNRYLLLFIYTSSILFSIIAVGIRTNAVFIPIFMISYASYNMFKGKLKLLKTLMTTSFIMLLVFLANSEFKKNINSVESYPIQYLQLYDLAGISTRIGTSLFPEYITKSEAYNFETVKSYYIESLQTTGNANKLVFLRDKEPAILPLTINKENLSELKIAWLKSIFEEPVAYIKHRLSLMKFFLFSGFYSTQMPSNDASRELLFSNFEMKNISGEYDQHFRLNSQKAILSIVEYFNIHGVLNGFYVLVFNILTLALALFIKKDKNIFRLIVLLSTTSLLYYAPYIIFLPASDFRYLYWPSVAASICIFIFFSIIFETIYKRLEVYLCRKMD
ncbi:hypothetical protein CGT86_03655 [Vibrio cholerae]|nr:hypothetical protein XM60_08005 [Vibrio cholerae]KQA80235.1 hypothetical protein XV86_14465 [Vibrio cholerae]KQA87691.1 hypothetical protein XV88_14850 [Vibrio cholerae]PAR78362.1 hypothetical protein CGT86_03655 [Vibrio cholerae]PAR89298.1 hypothetical protein CGT84_03200 [Vibrio cholerae]